MEGGGTTEQEGQLDVFTAARETKRHAAFLLKKNFIQQNEAYRLASIFFQAFLRKRCEFTSHELKRELHKVYLTPKVRVKVDAFVDKLAVLEYAETQFGQAEVQQLLTDLVDLVDHMVSEHRQQVPALTRFANWLFRKKPKRQTIPLSGALETEEQNPATVELNSLLEEIYQALKDGKAHKAVRKYHKLLEKYHKLGSTAQHEFYHKVHGAYQELMKQKQ